MRARTMLCVGVAMLTCVMCGLGCGSSAKPTAKSSDAGTPHPQADSGSGAEKLPAQDAGTASDAAAASTSAADGGNASAGASVESACATYVQAVCARRDACSGTYGNQVTYGDIATCRQRELHTCQGSLTAVGSHRKPADVLSCAAALASEACADWVTGSGIAGCQTPPGDGPIGAACGFNSQCQSVYCRHAVGSACGVCALQPKAGEPCSAANSCAAGLACSRGFCVVPGALSAACRADTDCAFGLVCVSGTQSQGGSCQNAVSSFGATCDPSESAGPGCNRHLYLWCCTTNDTCLTYGFAGVGEACGPMPGNYVACRGGADCNSPSPNTVGTCRAPAADGDACDTLHGPFCLLPARCVVTADAGSAGTCQLQNGACH